MNILELFYLMIPAYLANMTPVFARKIQWNTPLDFGLSFRGKRIFGNNKTIKGLLTGILTGTLVGSLLSNAYWPISSSPTLWSFLTSTGALLGDATKSFFKRQMNIKSGKPWIPFDQIDYAIGALLLGSIIFFPGWINSSIIILVSLLGHIIVNHLAHFLGIRDEKW